MTVKAAKLLDVNVVRKILARDKIATKLPISTISTLSESLKRGTSCAPKK